MLFYYANIEISLEYLKFGGLEGELMQDRDGRGVTTCELHEIAWLLSNNLNDSKGTETFSFWRLDGSRDVIDVIGHLRAIEALEITKMHQRDSMKRKYHYKINRFFTGFNVFKKIIPSIQISFKLLNYDGLLRDFNEALELYKPERKAPIAMMRIVYEGLITNLIKEFNEKPINMKRNLEILEIHEILRETPGNRGDKHLDLTYSYNLYSRLSYYGSHPNPNGQDIYRQLFFETIGWMEILLKRFDLTYI